MEHWLDRVLNWIYPVDCAACGGPATERRLPCFCRACWETIHPITGPICPCCGRPFDSNLALAYSPGHHCASCREQPPAYDQAFSPFRYEGALERAICLYKYRRRVALAGPLAQLALTWQARLPPVDVVIPVPLHPQRLRTREFNQALLLADRIASRLERPLVYEDLQRLRPTPPQTQLDRAERARNVRHAFAVRPSADLQGRRVLLVDDVMTTGATVGECAKALRQAGVTSVVVLTVARRV